MSSVVRVQDELHAKLRALAEAEQRPIGQVIQDAIQRYEREKFWHGVNEDLARLQSNPVAWQEYQEEIKAWDATAGDGLEHEEAYYTPAEEEEIDAHYARTFGG